MDRLTERIKAPRANTLTQLIQTFKNRPGRDVISHGCPLNRTEVATEEQNRTGTLERLGTAPILMKPLKPSTSWRFGKSGIAALAPVVLNGRCYFQSSIRELVSVAFPAFADDRRIASVGGYVPTGVVHETIILSSPQAFTIDKRSTQLQCCRVLLDAKVPSLDELNTPPPVDIYDSLQEPFSSRLARLQSCLAASSRFPRSCQYEYARRATSALESVGIALPMKYS